MTSVKVKFTPSSVILKEGSVHYQIIHHCKVRHIRTGYKLFPSEWISASGEINVSAGSGEGRKSYLAALKNQIDKDLFRIKKCINRLNQEDSPFTVDRIIELYTVPEGNCTFLLYGKELLVELRQIGKVRTAGTYQNALNSFERFRGHRGDIMEDIPNRTEDLKERFMELNAAYQGNIILHLAAENMLDNLFEERLAKNDLLPLGNEGKHLLVETSYFNPPMGLNNILLRIKSKGYVPVLAHPERYVYMDAGDYRQLKEMNVMFQLNLSSIVGGYGTEVKKKAEWLLKNGFYDLAGSDTHGLAVLEAVLCKQKLPQTGHEQVFKADLW